MIPGHARPFPGQRAAPTLGGAADPSLRACPALSDPSPVCGGHCTLSSPRGRRRLYVTAPHPRSRLRAPCGTRCAWGHGAGSGHGDRPEHPTEAGSPKPGDRRSAQAPAVRRAGSAPSSGASDWPASRLRNGPCGRQVGFGPEVCPRAQSAQLLSPPVVRAAVSDGRVSTAGRGPAGEGAARGLPLCAGPPRGRPRPGW